jgi:hypothetical protein
MLVSKHGKRNPYILLVRKYINATTIEISTEIPQKIEIRTNRNSTIFRKTVIKMAIQPKLA